MDINIFTGAMRAEFLKAYQNYDPAKPAPWEAFTTRLNSTVRIENYAWMTPVPGIQQYRGYRRLANSDGIKYTVTNLEYDASFEVNNRDIEDDQVGGYKFQSAQLATKASLYPGRLALKTLALGKTGTGFDATAFFATSHTIGSGNNLMTFNGAADGGEDNNLCMLIHDGQIKPLVYQDRKPPKFMNDAGEKANSFAKKTKFWVDLEGAGAYGYWWDAIYMDVTDLPSVAEAQVLLDQIWARFMTFKLPKALASDDDEYVHEQLVPSTASCTLVVSPALFPVFNQVKTKQLVGDKIATGAATASYVAADNRWYGCFNLIATNFLTPGVVAA